MKTSKNGTSKQRSKPERSITVLEQPTADTDGWGAVKIAVNGKSETYLVHFIPSDFGFGAFGFEVEKLDTDLATVENYEVHLSGNEADCSCSCKGFTYHHKPCKHLDGLKTLTCKFPRLWSGCDHRRNPEQPEEPTQADYEQGGYDPAS